jgi:polysaccharide export outer membrane protein
MKLNIKVFSLWVLLGAFSCTSYKQIPYFQAKGNPLEFETQSYADKSIVRFQPDDVLAITINVVGEQKIALDYNLPIQPAATSFEGEGELIDQSIGRQTYLVSKKGEIDFPTLGTIKVAGYTQEELQEHINGLLRDRLMLVSPIVTVRLMNFRIMVLGEVGKPGQYTINKTRFDIFEAITLAGDLTVFGKRNNVLIRRQLPDGTFKYVRLDLSKAEVSASPYFYLRQNDMIYVQPNRVKALQSDVSMWSIMLSVASFLMGVVTFVAIYTKK